MKTKKPAGRGNIAALQNVHFSPGKRGETGNRKNIGTAWWTCATWGCSWGSPGARLVAFRGPHEGPPGTSRVSEYAIFLVFYMGCRFWALLAIRPLKKETWAELLLTP